MDFTGKKLLFLGGFASLREAVQYANSQGIYTISTDFYPTGPAKAVANEAWQISTADLDILADKCREVGVDGLFAGFDDFNVGKAARLAQMIGVPYYLTPELADRTMDKALFKQTCIDYGVPVTERLDWEGTPSSELTYPVIVKQVDGSGSRGITVCWNAAEFDEAIAKARRISKSGEILVERYYEGDEIGVNYIMQDGRVACTAIHDRYLQVENESVVKLPLAYVYPSRYAEVYMQGENKAVVDMFEGIGAQNGTLFLQGCVDNGIASFYEAGYRLNGAKQYHFIEKECGFNPMHCLVQHTLTGSMSDQDIVSMADPRYDRYYCTLSLLTNPGTIAEIRGLREIEAMPNVIAMTERLFAGNVLDESTLGTQKLIATRPTFVGSSLDELATVIEAINKVYDVVDAEGNSMEMEVFDPNRLFD